MAVQPDFKELFESLNKHGVEYIVVGAYAPAFHGVPRYTGDLDLYVRSDPKNARRRIAALADFGFGSLGLEPTDFESPGRVIQLGAPPVRVDLLTSITGVDWKQANENKQASEYGDVPIHILGREELVFNKRAVGRTRDLADLEALGE